LARAIGKDFKGKISPVLYAMAIVVAFFIPWISYTIYVLVALMWLFRIAGSRPRVPHKKLAHEGRSKIFE